jgi:hypothetical protein
VVRFARHDPAHPLLDVFREVELWYLVFQGLQRPVPSAVAVESSGHVRSDEVLVREVEGTQYVSLLTELVLLMVAER